MNLEKNVLKIGLINIGTLNPKNDSHDFSKKEIIKHMFEEDK